MTDIELARTIGTYVLSNSGAIALVIWLGKRAVKHYYELKDKSVLQEKEIVLLKDQVEKERIKNLRDVNNDLSDSFHMANKITASLQTTVAYLEEITKSHGAEIARLRMSIQAFDRGLNTLKMATQKTDASCTKMVTFMERFTKRYDKKIQEQDDKVEEFGKIIKLWEMKNKGDQ